MRCLNLLNVVKASNDVPQLVRYAPVGLCEHRGYFGYDKPSLSFDGACAFIPLNDPSHSHLI